MDNIIREERGIEAIIETKEKAIIDLYAKRNCINEKKAELIYHRSQLKNIIRDKESTLYLESAYYILDRYSEYMTPVRNDIYYKNRFAYPTVNYYPNRVEIDSMERTAIPDVALTVSNLRHISFEQVAVHEAHHFAQLEQYRLLKEENIRLNNMNSATWMIFFAGSPDIEKMSLASCFAERYKELGIISNGKVVEIDEQGFIGQYLGNDVHSINMNNLWIIEEEHPNTMDKILIGNQGIKNKLKRVTNFKKEYLNAELAIYASYCNGEEDEETHEEITDIKRVLEAL